MKMTQTIFVSLILFLTGCVTTESQSVQKDDSKSEKVSLCQVKANPPAYNHKLIEVTGFVSQGFENFTISDPSCSSGFSIWLEYGGTAASGTMYCCGVTAERKRPKQLVVEDIPIPLVEDELFRTFDKRLQRPPDSTVHATIVGRFFSGEKIELPGGTIYGNYGHMGCCSLLAIQQVVSVDNQQRSDLDYGASYDQPDTSCYQFLKVSETDQDLIQAQQKAEADSSGTNLNSPEQVAASTLARILKIDEKLIKLKQTRKAQGRFVYWWKPKTKEEKYMVVVSRPYWLSFYAKDPQKVAWVVTAAYETTCD